MVTILLMFIIATLVLNIYNYNLAFNIEIPIASDAISSKDCNFIYNRKDCYSPKKSSYLSTALQKTCSVGVDLLSRHHLYSVTGYETSCLKFLSLG